MKIITLTAIALFATSCSRESDPIPTPETTFPTWEQVGPKYQIREESGGFRVCYKAWDASDYDCNPCVFPTMEAAERVRDVVEEELHGRYEEIKDAAGDRL